MTKTTRRINRLDINYHKKGNYGFYHRVDGPAMICVDGTELWMYDNQLHRLDGPAGIYPDGGVGYWIHGKNFQQDVEAFLAYKEKHGL